MTGSKLIHVQRGNEIYAAGEEAAALYKVCSGAVILFMILEDGRRQIIDLAGPGDLLHFDLDGELDHFAEALTETELAVFDGASALGDPDFLPFFLEQTRARLAMDRRHITMLGRKTAQERLADFLECVSECLGSAPGEIDLPMTRQQIADYLGLTLETVSRIFARWVREGRLVQVAPGQYELPGYGLNRVGAAIKVSALLAA
ncbi:helix-turn-helix domain-containing protein [Parvularcula sp. ZS-1/3]|uniref:Helix-turn-helix domain-containing protein n=1 Tax=Parvularcula mediterranea TaxID=2732508 RepID=A0A7Y3RPX6_9PROT|nr:helix-turn-helix domain-containing protein [Parvularcula mediterranea]NNU17561.1 helix-turn-helix domain-containing protein [Parvularcula mediterranea]